MIRVLRGEILERIKTQHQLAVLAGASSAAGATLIAAKESISPWIPFGFSLLFIAFLLSMLNNDLLIARAIDFIIKEDTPDSHAQFAWEEYLHKQRALKGFGAIGQVLGPLSNFALPILGAAASIVAFYSDDDAAQCWVLVPLVLVAGVGLLAIRNAKAFKKLGEPRQQA